MKIVADGRPHRIEDEVDPLTPSKFRSRHKVTVTGNENHLIDETFVGKRRHVQPEPHVDAFLPHFVLNVLGRQLRHRKLAREEALEHFLSQYPACRAVVQIPKSNRHLAFLLEFPKAAQAPACKLRTGEVDRQPSYGVMDLLAERWTVVIENAVELTRFRGRLTIAASMLQVFATHPVQRFRHFGWRPAPLQATKPPEEEPAIDEYRCRQ